MHVKLPTTRSLLEVLVWSWIYTGVLVIGVPISQDSWSLRAPPAICTLLSAFQNLSLSSLSPGGECMACFANPNFAHLCWLKRKNHHRRWNPVFLCRILLRWSNRGWSLPLALELAPMPSWKRHGEPKITCCAAEIPHGAPWAMLLWWGPGCPETFGGTTPSLLFCLVTTLMIWWWKSCHMDFCH